MRMLINQLAWAWYRTHAATRAGTSGGYYGN